MEQLILHLIGDYITQSDWMANNKTKNSNAAGLHAMIYSLPFLFLGPSLLAFWVIFSTHFFIDRFRLARFVVYVKNIVLRPGFFDMVTIKAELEWFDWRWENCDATGYQKQKVNLDGTTTGSPPWLAVWLLIIADNTLHVAINYCALRWL